MEMGELRWEENCLILCYCIRLQNIHVPLRNVAFACKTLAFSWKNLHIPVRNTAFSCKTSMFFSYYFCIFPRNYVLWVNGKWVMKIKWEAKLFQWFWERTTFLGGTQYFCKGTQRFFRQSKKLNSRETNVLWEMHKQWIRVGAKLCRTPALQDRVWTPLP